METVKESSVPKSPQLDGGEVGYIWLLCNALSFLYPLVSSTCARQVLCRNWGGDVAAWGNSRESRRRKGQQREVRVEGRTVTPGWQEGKDRAQLQRACRCLGEQDEGCSGERSTRRK